MFHCSKIAFIIIRAVTCILYLLFSLSIKGQSIQISKNKVIAIIENNSTWIEPIIVSHPSEKDFLIATAFKSDINDIDKMIKNNLSVFISKNKGETWNKKDISCIECTDPWITITNKGIIFLTVLGVDPKTRDVNDFTNILVFTSKDNGESWSQPQVIKGSHDGPRTVSDIDGTLYLASTWTVLKDDEKREAIFLGRAEPDTILINRVGNYIPSNLSFNFDMLAILNDGSVAITYLDLLKKVNGNFTSRKSRLKTPRAWMVTSSDRGETFSLPCFISEAVAYRPSALLSGFEKSNSNYDKLFYVGMNKSLKDVVFAYSNDFGEEWISKEIEPSAEHKLSRFSPNIMMNNDGVLVIAWIDYRNSNENNRCYDIYICVSIDKGETFSNAIRVSEESSCPDIENLAPASRWRSGGDYFGITSTEDGIFHLVWSDARSGAFEVMYSSIKISPY